MVLKWNVNKVRKTFYRIIILLPEHALLGSIILGLGFSTVRLHVSKHLYCAHCSSIGHQNHRLTYDLRARGRFNVSCAVLI